MLNDNCNSMIKSRSSIRKFKKATIPDNDINEIIEIGTKAPSAGNCQPWRVVVAKDAATVHCNLDKPGNQAVRPGTTLDLD